MLNQTPDRIEWTVAGGVREFVAFCLVLGDQMSIYLLERMESEFGRVAEVGFVSLCVQVPCALSGETWWPQKPDILHDR